MEYTISLHLKSKTERNPTIAAIIYNGAGIGFPSRILKHRGIDTMAIAWRPATQPEIEIMKKMWRERLYTYETWEGLIEDELAATQNEEWIKEIIKARGL